MNPPSQNIGKLAARLSTHLPLIEIFYLIDQGFDTRVGKYDQSKWIPPGLNEDIVDTYKRYKDMIGQEEFQSLATMICYLRLTQPVCSQCEKTDVRLRKCTACQLTFYCSKDCQVIHWNTHRKWCRKKYSNERDSGPAAITLCPIDKKKNIKC